ncbi:MAG: GNAT family N-acetyltransferase [Bacteroidetes bacterium]|nr:GNAT family N-acetyltransferase [Bacteroidota bacterium]
MIDYRAIQLKDAEQIQLLSAQLGYKITLKQTIAQIISIQKDENAFAILAIQNEKVCGWLHGFIAIRLESLPFAEIGGLIVDENHRNKGIANGLIQEFVHWSKSKNIDKVRVRCNAIRTETHVFYEKLGFVENKTQRVFDLKM